MCRVSCLIQSQPHPVDALGDGVGGLDVGGGVPDAVRLAAAARRRSKRGVDALPPAAGGACVEAGAAVALEVLQAWG